MKTIACLVMLALSALGMLAGWLYESEW